MKRFLWLLCWVMAWGLSACQAAHCMGAFQSQERLHRVTQVVSSTVILDQDWSPTGLHFVIDGEQDRKREPGSFTTFSTIYTANQDKSAEVWFSYKWGGIVGWTADGRYALFSTGDQYGNADAYAFDTQEWHQHSLDFSEERGCREDSPCRHGIEAIAPQTSRVMISDGNLVDLSNWAYTNVISATGRDSVRVAAWSPDESQLIFVAYQHKKYSTDDYALFLAKGDGTQVRSLTLISPTAKSIAWESDGQCASVSASEKVYILDLTSDQVWARPAPQLKDQISTPPITACNVIGIYQYRGLECNESYLNH